MKRKLILGFVSFNILIFLIPVLFSFFIKSPAELTDAFAKISDKQTVKPVMISALDTKTGKTETFDMEEYLIGVLCAEMPASYEPEALKAQAVAARSYLVSKLNTKNPSHPGAVVCNNPAHCKGHLSLSEAKKVWGKAHENDYYLKYKKAVKETEGEYLVYDGKAVEAFFFALSNGKTEASGEVWQTDLPYLKPCESEADRLSPDFYSVAEFSVSDFNQRLKKLNSSYAPSEKITVKNISYTEGERVKSIEINGTLFSGTDIRGAFGLNSTDFTVTQKDNKIIFNVEGKGHGVGMSQYGANALAKEGKGYREILKHYYSGVEIQIWE